MKKNKTVAYMLAATLLVGGTFLGTKALFTDSVEVKNKLIMTTGTVDVEATDGKWMLNKSTEYTNEKKLVPGDELTKIITVTNKSNVPTKLKIVDNNKDNSIELQKAIESGFISISEITRLGNDLQPGKSADILLTVKIGTNKNHDVTDNMYQNKMFDLSEVMGCYTINVTQAEHVK